MLSSTVKYVVEELEKAVGSIESLSWSQFWGLIQFVADEERQGIAQSQILADTINKWNAGGF